MLAKDKILISRTEKVLSMPTISEVMAKQDEREY